MKSNILRNFLGLALIADSLGKNTLSEPVYVNRISSYSKTPLTNKQRNLRKKNKTARKARARNRR
jgi:hypothetical protein